MDSFVSNSSLGTHLGGTCIMPLSYLPPVRFYQLMLKYKKIIFDIHEHFHKQFYFNRCEIYGANGKLRLSVPIAKNHERSPLKDISIFYGDKWKTIHWRSLQAAYRRSPFFEYYEDSFKELYTGNDIVKLMDWNIALFNMVNKLLDVDVQFSFTESYEKTYPDADDYRGINIPKADNILGIEDIKYQQVFEEKYGFINNLSIVDLLFCEGHYAKQLLLS